MLAVGVPIVGVISSKPPEEVSIITAPSTHSLAHVLSYCDALSDDLISGLSWLNAQSLCWPLYITKAPQIDAYRY